MWLKKRTAVAVAVATLFDGRTVNNRCCEIDVEQAIAAKRLMACDAVASRQKFRLNTDCKCNSYRPILCLERCYHDVVTFQNEGSSSDRRNFYALVLAHHYPSFLPYAWSLAITPWVVPEAWRFVAVGDLKLEVAEEEAGW